MTIDPNEKVFIEGELERSTDKAIQVLWKTEQIWLPKSQITYDCEAEVGTLIEVELPIWLARSKGVI